MYGLVLIGIATLFVSLPFDHQPWFTMILADAGHGLIHYGPHAEEAAWIATGAISAILVLLACVPLYAALCSSGPRLLAILLLAPLALSALGWIASSVIAWAHPPLLEEMVAPLFFVDPVRVALVIERGIAAPYSSAPADLRAAGQWLIILTIALWLSVAQVRARRSPAPDAPGGETRRTRRALY